MTMVQEVLVAIIDVISLIFRAKSRALDLVWRAQSSRGNLRSANQSSGSVVELGSCENIDNVVV